MTDLAAFILARIEEDQAVARVAAPGPWVTQLPAEPRVSAADESLVMYGINSRSWASDARHIARHDPARVLAQCAALRAVVNEAAALLDSWDHVHEGTAGLAMWPDVNRRERSQAHRRLRALASIWAEHESFDPTWRLG